MYADRTDAGRQVARALAAYRDQDVVVLGLPRGGVPVAAQVATALDAPLDVIVVRKLGVRVQPELAMGAIGEDGTRFLYRDVIDQGRIGDEEIAAVEQQERTALQARVTRLRQGRAPVPLAGRTAIVVDDGIATGSTVRVACLVARARGAARVIVAVPVGPADVAARIPEADEVVCVRRPRHFAAVGASYRDFAPTTDDEVAALLAAAPPW